MTEHRAKLRRLRILQTLQLQAPSPVGELALLNRLALEAELSPTLELVREDLGYLWNESLVELLSVEGAEWLAGYLTAAGEQWLDNPGEHGLAIYSPDELPEQSGNRNGRVSSIDTLPPEARAWLDHELISSRFRDYQGIVDKLQERGYAITRSALGRYAKRKKADIKRLQERADLARELSNVFAGDAPSMMEGALGVSFTAVIDAIQEGDFNPGNDSLAGLAGVIPRLAKGFQQVERHRIEREARRKALEEAADRVEETAKARGMTAKDARFWRQQVLKGM